MLASIPFPAWLKPEIIPGLPIRWYGLMYLVAFAVTYVLFRYQVKEREIEVKRDDILDMFFWIILGLIIGARIFATTVYATDNTYLKAPWLIFWPFRNGRFTGLPGMSYHGGLVGVVIAFVIYCRKKKIDALDWGDMLVTGVPLGYTFGRLGNFINGELFGRVTAVPWGFTGFKYAEPADTSFPQVQEIAAKLGIDITGMSEVMLPRHPSQLYEAFFEGLVLWLILWFVFRKRKPFGGFMIAVYLIGYGVVRFLIEYVRQPDTDIGFPIQFVSGENPIYLYMTPWNFTTGQILNFFMIVAGIILLPVFKSRAERKALEPQEKPKTNEARKLRKKIK